MGQDFEDLQDAVYAAAPGDIIHVAGSVDNYGFIQVDRPLMIYGPGYLLSANALKSGGQNRAASVQALTIESEDVLVSGLSIQDLDIINVPRAYIKGNHIDGHVTLDHTDYVLFSQNLFWDKASYMDGVRINVQDSDEVVFKNNIILGLNYEIRNEQEEISNHTTFSHNLLIGDLEIRSNYAYNPDYLYGNYYYNIIVPDTATPIWPTRARTYATTSCATNARAEAPPGRNVRELL